LQAEMWLQLANGRKFSGVDAWSALMRRVGWLWPVGIVLAAPGFNAAGRAVYRQIAKRRHCLAGVCTLPDRTGSHSLTGPDPLPDGKIPSPRRIRTEPTRRRAFLDLP